MKSVMIVTVVLLLTACSAAASGRATPTDTPTSSATPTAQPAVTVPDVTGLDGASARDALTAEGFTVVFASDTGKAVILKSNWTVTTTDPAAGVQAPAGASITVHVTKPTPTPEPPAPEPAAPEPAPAPAPAVEPQPQPAQPGPSVSYANCAEARASGAAPIRRGEPGYAPKLDRDGDGIACE